MVANARQYGFRPDDIVSIQLGCPCCGEARTVAVDYNDWIKLRDGADVDDCFLHLPIEQRVLFTGGVCPMCVEF